MRFGFADSMVGFQRALPIVAPLGTSVARLPIPVDHPDLALQVEHFVQTTVRNNDVRPMVCLTSSDPDPGAFVDAAARLAERYRKIVWQVLNEPNAPEGGSLRPRDVARLAERVRLAVRPGSAVIGPAMNPNKLGGWAWEDYFRAVYGETAIDPSLHLYPKKAVGKEVGAALELAKRFDEFGPIHVTEMGVQRRLFGDRSPELTRRMYRMVEDAGAADAIFYSLTRLVERPGDWFDQARCWFVDDEDRPTDLFRAIERDRGAG